MIKKFLVPWMLFSVTIAIFVGFYFWKPFVGGTTLDNVCSLESMQLLLQNMTDVQKYFHIMMTLILDMIFPFVYGLLFADLILRFSGQKGVWLALPAFVVIPVDIAENIIQLMALTGNVTLLSVKVFLTPLKFGLICFSILLIVGLLIKMFGKKRLKS